MRAGTNLTTNVSPRSTLSLYHAHIAGLLEMPADEFLAFLVQASERNPFLEVQTGREDFILSAGQLVAAKSEEGHRMCYSSYDPYASSRDFDEAELEHVYDFTESLPFYLATQIFWKAPSLPREVVEILVEFISDRGFLEEDPDVIAADQGLPQAEIREVLEIIRTIPPGGIGSRDLPDFLWFQCQEKGWGTREMQQLVFELLRDVAQGSISKIHRKLGISEKKTDRMIKSLKSLRPYPTWGMDFQSSDKNRGLADQAPDFHFYQRDDGNYVLQMQEPIVEVQHLLPLWKPEGETIIGNRYTETDWIAKAVVLEQEAVSMGEATRKRRHILQEIVTALLDLQKDWLVSKKDYLEPLTESQLAEQLGIPVSTVSRALKDRYIVCPRGTFPLKHLLSRCFPSTRNGGISKDFICRLITKHERETEGKAIADIEMARLLARSGIQIARRTVNKYRNELRGF